MTGFDDEPVALRDLGDGPGRPLLLVHGFGGSKEDFDAVVETLAADRRVVAVDLPGHGRTPGPGDPSAYGLATTATWLLRLADRLGLGEMHLLGHSLGGLVIQRIASVASHRLASMTLADSGMGAPRDEVAEGVTRIAVAARDDGIEAAWAVARREEDRGPDVDPDDEREVFVRTRFLSMDPATVVGTARSLISAAPLVAFLRGIDIPVLVIHGEDDQAWTAAEQAELARVIPPAERVVVAGAAHVPQLENPKDWLVAVTDFLARAEAATAR